MPVTKPSEKLTDQQFQSLINLLMCADPWHYPVDRDPLIELADSESRERGFSDWIHAYHAF